VEHANTRQRSAKPYRAKEHDVLDTDLVLVPAHDSSGEAYEVALEVVTARARITMWAAVERCIALQLVRCFS
jgi:hypothetical protein